MAHIESFDDSKSQKGKEDELKENSSHNGILVLHLLLH